MKLAVSFATLSALFAAVYANANAFTSPLGGETWTAGETVHISWANASGSSITLELVQGESTNVQVAAVITKDYHNTANSAGIVNVNWAIPSDLPNGKYALEIVNNDNTDEVNYSGWIEVEGGASNATSSGSASANSTLPSSAAPTANSSSIAESSAVPTANVSTSLNVSSSAAASSSFANSSSEASSEATSTEVSSKTTSEAEDSTLTQKQTKTVLPTATESSSASATSASSSKESSANAAAGASIGVAGIIGAVAFALL